MLLRKNKPFYQSISFIFLSLLLSFTTRAADADKINTESDDDDLIAIQEHKTKLDEDEKKYGKAPIINLDPVFDTAGVFSKNISTQFMDKAHKNLIKKVLFHLVCAPHPENKILVSESIKNDLNDWLNSIFLPLGGNGILPRTFELTKAKTGFMLNEEPMFYEVLKEMGLEEKYSKNISFAGQMERLRSNLFEPALIMAAGSPKNLRSDYKTPLDYYFKDSHYDSTKNKFNALMGIVANTPKGETPPSGIAEILNSSFSITNSEKATFCKKTIANFSENFRQMEAQRLAPPAALPTPPADVKAKPDAHGAVATVPKKIENTEPTIPFVPAGAPHLPAADTINRVVVPPKVSGSVYTGLNNQASLESATSLLCRNVGDDNFEKLKNTIGEWAGPVRLLHKKYPAEVQTFEKNLQSSIDKLFLEKTDEAWRSSQRAPLYEDLKNHLRGYMMAALNAKTDQEKEISLKSLMDSRNNFMSGLGQNEAGIADFCAPHHIVADPNNPISAIAQSPLDQLGNTLKDAPAPTEENKKINEEVTEAKRTEQMNQMQQKYSDSTDPKMFLGNLAAVYLQNGDPEYPMEEYKHGTQLATDPKKMLAEVDDVLKSMKMLSYTEIPSVNYSGYADPDQGGTQLDIDRANKEALEKNKVKLEKFVAQLQDKNNSDPKTNMEGFIQAVTNRVIENNGIWDRTLGKAKPKIQYDRSAARALTELRIVQAAVKLELMNRLDLTDNRHGGSNPTLNPSWTAYLRMSAFRNWSVEDMRDYYTPLILDSTLRPPEKTPEKAK